MTPLQQTTTYGPAWRNSGCVVRMAEGEVADRLTIALLKLVHGHPGMPKLLAQLLDVRQYAEQWMSALDGLTADARTAALDAFTRLAAINELLWNTETTIRALRQASADTVTAQNAQRLSEVALTISKNNDIRAQIKSEINGLFNTTGDIKVYATES